MQTTVASLSKAKPFSPEQTQRSWVRIPLEVWRSVCVYSVCVVLCAGTGLATGCGKLSNIQTTKDLSSSSNSSNSQKAVQRMRALGPVIVVSSF
jgi:hypothetical protein